MKDTEYFVSYKCVCVALTEECNVMVNSGKLTGITEYPTLWTKCHINRCRYNWV